MKKVLLLAVTLVLASMIAMGGVAQVKKGKTRAATTKQLMSGLVRPNCAALGKGTKQAPADEKAWAALATNAALLNEAGHILMADGRCPDGDWAKAAKTLQTASAAALKKIDAKDVEGTAAEFKKLTTSCAACHKAHKK